MSLTGKTKASTYKDILQMNNSNSGVDGTIRNVVDGEGTASALYLSDDGVSIKPQNDDTTATFQVNSKSGTELLKVDATTGQASRLCYCYWRNSYSKRICRIVI